MNRPPLIFIIDDDHEDREIFRDVLKSIDQHIHLWESYDAEEALLKLSMADRYVPDAIFLDLNMPKINGKECLKQIRRIEKAKDIPIYIYTTSANKRDRDESLLSGATSFITKTADLKRLKNLLEKIINGSPVDTD